MLNLFRVKLMHFRHFIVLVIALNILPIYALSPDNIVLGIFTQQYIYSDHTLNSQSSSYNFTSKLTYILPTYLQLAHMSGSQAIPIFSYSNQTFILDQLKKVNGVIFPGGEETIEIDNTWTKNAQFILKYAQKQNRQGRVFPILGICQGFQLMTYLTSNQRKGFLDHIDGQAGVYNTINFIKNFQTYNKPYYLLDGLPQSTLHSLTDPTATKQGGITFFYHSWGVLLSTFNTDKELSAYWNLFATTTSKTALKQTFVSYLQAKTYPFYVVMFHPERLAFNRQLSPELTKNRIELVNQISVNFMMKARQSVNRYPSDQLENDLMQNFQTFKSERFPNSKVFLFSENQRYLNEYNPINQQSSTNNFYLFVMVAIAAAGVVAFSIYNSYKLKKRQSRNFTQTNRNNNQMELNEQYS